VKGCGVLAFIVLLVSVAFLVLTLWSIDSGAGLAVIGLAIALTVWARRSARRQ
jgi:uncharacterized membrane protein